MNRLLIAGTGSGCGKTTVTCALLAAFKRRGKSLAAFKSGPDYIDPAFHKMAASIEAYNLDIFLMGEENTRGCLWRRGREKDLCVTEGVMGLYDGIGAGGYASANQLSIVTETPVVLVVNAKGKSRSVCAEISGYLNYDRNNVRAVILNNATEESYPFYKEMLERELPIRAAGFLPYIPEAGIASRHLGLVSPGEIADIKQKLGILAVSAEKNFELDLLLELAETATPLIIGNDPINSIKPEYNPKIYVAADEAFSFRYEDNHQLLRAYGAELRFFSPLHDRMLPNDADGLILWGGYPELYAEALSGNIEMKESIKRKVDGGMPVYAECGGFIYMQERLTDKRGETYPMLGIIKGSAIMTGRLVKFGYAELTANRGNMLCDKADKINAHSLRYFSSDYEGDAFTAAKKSNNDTYQCIVAEGNIFAGYPHIHFWGNPEMARRFVAACGRYGAEGKDGVYNET